MSDPISLELGLRPAVTDIAPPTRLLLWGWCGEPSACSASSHVLALWPRLGVGQGLQTG